MPQGYLATLTLDSDPYQFQAVSVDLGGDNLDTSASLNADGVTYNAGFTDTDGDLSSLTVEIDSIIKDATVQAQIALLQPKTKYPAATYSIGYGARTITGVGIYVDTVSLTFRIPGEARWRCRFMNTQEGFTLA